MIDMYTGRKLGWQMTAFCWVHVPIVAALAIFAGNDAWLPAAISAVLAGLATLDCYLSKGRGGVALGSALIAQPAMMVAAFAGHQWQVDMHMYFFAMMAVLSLLSSMPVLIAATGIVAVHHLALNAFLPELVYPGGSDLMRTLMHAVILIVESAGLCWMVYLRNKQEQTTQATAVETRELADRAEDARAKQEAANSRLALTFDAASGSISAMRSNSTQVRDLTDKISSGARDQSASVQSASSAIEQMAASVRQSSENASETETIARQAADRAASAGQTVGAAVESMQTIADKIGIVQEIARQTDLLALGPVEIEDSQIR